jgi:DNA-binding XRE family transcriptional regulator
MRKLTNSHRHIAMLIRAQRCSRRLSQPEMAKLCNLSVSWNCIAQIERGARSLPVCHINTVANSLGIDSHLIIDAIIRDFAESITRQVSSVAIVEDQSEQAYAE